MATKEPSVDRNKRNTRKKQYLTSGMYEKTFYVYILTNALKTVLYTGLTNDLQNALFNTIKTEGKTKLFVAGIMFIGFYFLKDTSTLTMLLQGKRK